jgi:hypothetical protein
VQVCRDAGAATLRRDEAEPHSITSSEGVQCEYASASTLTAVSTAHARARVRSGLCLCIRRRSSAKPTAPPSPTFCTQPQLETKLIRELLLPLPHLDDNVELDIAHSDADMPQQLLELRTDRWAATHAYGCRHASTGWLRGQARQRGRITR